jgi:hypothetical protein
MGGAAAVHYVRVRWRSRGMIGRGGRSFFYLEAGILKWHFPLIGGTKE